MMFGRKKRDCTDTVTIRVLIDPDEPRNKCFKLIFSGGKEEHEYTFVEEDFVSFRDVIDNALKGAAQYH